MKILLIAIAMIVGGCASLPPVPRIGVKQACIETPCDCRIATHQQIWTWDATVAIEALP